MIRNFIMGLILLVTGIIQYRKVDRFITKFMTNDDEDGK
jgi:hypothetical protein